MISFWDWIDQFPKSRSNKIWKVKTDRSPSRKDFLAEWGCSKNVSPWSQVFETLKAWNPLRCLLTQKMVQKAASYSENRSRWWTNRNSCGSTSAPVSSSTMSMSCKAFLEAVFNIQVSNTCLFTWNNANVHLLGKPMNGLESKLHLC